MPIPFGLPINFGIERHLCGVFAVLKYRCNFPHKKELDSIGVSKFGVVNNKISQCVLTDSMYFI